jgi:hypothetical protein
MKDENKSSKNPEKTDKTINAEKERYKGKMDKVQNKERTAAVKARAKKAGNEPVSDQKSHEYH